MSNEPMRERWDARAESYLANELHITTVTRPVTEALIAEAGPLTGRTVLDVGCGPGDLSALVVEHGATAVGVDISPVMIDAARARYPDRRFELADAQVADLTRLTSGRFDLVLSKFGVMFFADPVAAFANMRASVVPGASMVLMVWRSIEENPMFTHGVHFLAERLSEPPVPIQPGPDALADPVELRRVVEAAGWQEVRIAPIEVDLRFGRQGGDGVEERLSAVLSGGAVAQGVRELRESLGPVGWAAFEEELRVEIRTSVVDGVVTLPARLWCLRARALG